MGRFIVLTFAFLGWAFYEMSGGSEFVPAKAHLADVKTDPLKDTEQAQPVAANVSTSGTAAEPVTPEVTRVSLNLSSTQDVLNGTAVAPSQRLPQQATPAVLRTDDAATLPEPQQGESVSIIPSLVAGADAVTQPQADDATAPATAAVVSSVGGDLRTVKGNRVNMRGGPGTNHSVVGKLVRGDEVEILEDLGNGWVRLRAIESGEEGWMADFLLTSG